MSVAAVIEDAFRRYGLDPAVGLRIAQIESSMDPAAKNPNSSASGLFQFISSTAAQYGLTDPFDPAANADAGARFTRDNAAALRRVLGREPTVGELYLAHQQGAGGATKLLANPDAPAETLVGADAVRLNGGRPGMTAREFAELWMRKAGGDSPASVAASTLPPSAADAPPAAPGLAQAVTSRPGPADALGSVFAALARPQERPVLQAAPQPRPMEARAPDLGAILGQVRAPLTRRA